MATGPNSTTPAQTQGGAAIKTGPSVNATLKQQPITAPQPQAATAENEDQLESVKLWNKNG